MLPSVSSKKGKEEAVVEETTRKKEDLENHFKETVTRALTKLEVKEVVEKPTMDDQNRTFRTRLVAFWMLSNATLAVAIDMLNGLPSNDEAKDEAELQKKQNIYFAVILYSTFGLSLVRFIGVSGILSIPGLLILILCLLHSACGTSSSATFSGSAAGTRHPSHVIDFKSFIGHSRECPFSFVFASIFLCYVVMVLLIRTLLAGSSYTHLNSICTPSLVSYSRSA